MSHTVRKRSSMRSINSSSTKPTVAYQPHNFTSTNVNDQASVSQSRSDAAILSNRQQ